MDDDTRDLSVNIEPDRVATEEIFMPWVAKWYEVTRSQVAIAVAAGLLVAGLAGGAVYDSKAPTLAANPVEMETPSETGPTPAPTVLSPAPTQADPPPTPTKGTNAFYGVAPNTGEGMISIVARMCGLDAVGTWRANARDNGIAAPDYWVPLTARLDIDCEAEVLPPDPTELEPPAPVALAPEPAPAAPVVAGGWVAPLPGYGGTSSCNYWEWRGSYNHRGEDLAAPSGTPILAAAAGTIYSAGWDDGGGNMTVIVHEGGIATVYMHQSAIEIWSGWVAAGQVIGYVGNTGNSFGAHLHFEVQPWGPWNGVVDPVGFLADRGVSWGC